jgi:hypothetical protein
VFNVIQFSWPFTGGNYTLYPYKSWKLPFLPFLHLISPPQNFPENKNGFGIHFSSPTTIFSTTHFYSSLCTPRLRIIALHHGHLIFIQSSNNLLLRDLKYLTLHIHGFWKKCELYIIDFRSEKEAYQEFFFPLNKHEI